MGLTADEITNYLATIGRGYTRELRERLSMASAAEAGELIGQFGLGFLSAFLLASEVTLLTRSALGGSGYRWQSSGDEYLRPGPRLARGNRHHRRAAPQAGLRVPPAREGPRRDGPPVRRLPAHPHSRQRRGTARQPARAAVGGRAARAPIKDYITRGFRTEPLWVLPLGDSRHRPGPRQLSGPVVSSPSSRVGTSTASSGVRAPRGCSSQWRLYWRCSSTRSPGWASTA